MEDSELLARYASEGNPQVFADLVHRHADLVWSAARRQLSDATLAEDVTQAVFLLLSKKAKKIRGPLAAWLLVTTFYCCRDARKMATRRRIHERRAAEMRPETIEPSADQPWESYAGNLDEALAALRRKDRDAVVLRYMQGKSLKEVATALGVSEEAARKRADRGLNRLRGKLAVTTSAVLAGHLTAHATHAAPAQLVVRICTTSAAKGTLAAAIAHKTGMTILRIKLKLAAIIVGMSTVTATGAGLVIKLAQNSPEPAPLAQNFAGPAPAPVDAGAFAASQPAPTTLPADEIESQQRGQIQIVKWDIVLDENGLAALQGLGKPIQTASKLYVPAIWNGAELRHAVAAQMNSGDVPLVSTQMEYVNFGMGQPSYWGMNQQLWFNYTSDNLSLYGGSQVLNQDQYQRVDDDHVHIFLNHPDIVMSIVDRPYNKDRKAGIVFDGNLASGEALAFLADYPGNAGAHYGHLVVWETYKMLPDQAREIEMPHDAGWWCQHGPPLLRHWVDAERVWVANVPMIGLIYGAPSIEKKLDDKRSIWLMALSRPSKWPYCWWDPQGNPVDPGGAGAFYVGGDLPDGLWARFGCNPGQINGRLDEAFRIPDGATSIDVGVPLDQGREVARLKMNESAQVGDLTLSVGPMEQNKYWVRAKLSGMTDDEFHAIGMRTDGTHTDDRYWPGYGLKIGHETAPSDQTVDIPCEADQLDYVLVMRDQRVWTTFDHFAADPTKSPPQNSTPEDAEHAMKVASDRQESETEAGRLKFYEDQKKKAAAAPDVAADIETARGSLKAFVEAAHRGDEKALAGLLFSSKPDGADFVKSEAHYLVLLDELWTESVKRFGEKDVVQKLPLTNLSVALASANWKSMPDGSLALPDANVFVRKGSNGVYRLDLTEEEIDETADMKRTGPGMEAAKKLLDQNPAVTLDQLKTALTPLAN